MIKMKKIPSSLFPNSDYKLIRLGSLKDGGFLVCEKDIEESEMLISFGLGINWEFEKDYSLTIKIFLNIILILKNLLACIILCHLQR